MERMSTEQNRGILIAQIRNIFEYQTETLDAVDLLTLMELALEAIGSETHEQVESLREKMVQYFYN